MTTKSNSLKAAHAAKRAKLAAGELRKRDPLEKWVENPTSLRLSIDAECYGCNGQDADPCWQWRVGNCHITDCPLWHVRPQQKLYGRPEPAALRRPRATEDS